MKKYKIAAAAAIVVAIAAMITLSTPTVKAANTSDKIENGIYIGSINISGLTKEEAVTAVDDYVASLNDVDIMLHAMNDNSIILKPGEIGIKWSNRSVVEEAYDLGKSGNIIQRYKALKDLEFENEVYPLELSFDRTVIEGAIESSSQEFNVEAKDAILKRANDEFEIEAGQTGVLIDVTASVDAVYEYLTTKWDHQVADFDMVVTVDEPRGTIEELSKVKDVLGTFTTSYSDSGFNRSTNIENGSNLIDGTILYPGDSFSTYEAISPFTAENGYYMAGSYLNGLVVDSMGGGICQVSTTLYNTVLRAELEVTERSGHSMIVSYVDRSADAAISGTIKDFKFVNSLDYPVYIEGVSQNKKITFTIYGVEERPANRTIRFVSEDLSRTDPTEERIVANASQPVGFVDVQAAHVGFVSQLWKIVEEDGVEVSRDLVSKTSYKVAPRTATVGTATADPNVAAAINAAIATGSIDHCRAMAAALSGVPGAVVPPPAPPPIPEPAPMEQETPPEPTPAEQAAANAVNP